MPLKPALLDLRQHPLCERPMQMLLSLERMPPGETFLVVNDHDPELLLQQLGPVFQRGFNYWVAEEGAEIWRIVISRESN